MQLEYKDIALRLEAIALRLEAIALRLEAIALLFTRLPPAAADPQGIKP